MYESLQKPFEENFLKAGVNPFSEENARSGYEILIKHLCRRDTEFGIRSANRGL
jgi:hypothetical protein